VSTLHGSVYRIQDKEGRGPWRPGFSHIWIEDRDDHNNLLPWYIEFGSVLHAQRGYAIGCGCLSLDQLRRWFIKTEYNRLKLLGYSAVKMQFDRILGSSDIQCVFERKLPLNRKIKTIELY